MPLADDVCGCRHRVGAGRLLHARVDQPPAGRGVLDRRAARPVVVDRSDQERFGPHSHERTAPRRSPAAADPPQVAGAATRRAIGHGRRWNALGVTTRKAPPHSRRLEGVVVMFWCPEDVRLAGHRAARPSRCRRSGGGDAPACHHRSSLRPSGCGRLFLHVPAWGRLDLGVLAVAPRVRRGYLLAAGLGEPFVPGRPPAARNALCGVQPLVGVGVVRSAVALPHSRRW